MAYTTPRTWTDGELVDDSIMNTHVRDQFNAMGPHLIARKSSDQSVTSSTVMVNDNTLALPAAANEAWQIEFLLLADKGPGGMDVRWTFPSGGYLSLVVTLDGSGSPGDLATGTSPTTDHPLGTETAGDRRTYPFRGTYVNGGTGGTLQLQFAQNVSNGTPCIMKTNSTLWAVKLA